MIANRWDPYRELLNMQRAMDRLFDESSRSSGTWAANMDRNLLLDVIENEDEYIVKASLPGIDPDQLEITFNNQALTIRGELKPEEDAEENYILRERSYGVFVRTITLPNSIRSTDISGDYEAGVLTLHLPKAEEVKPRRIQIQSGAQKKVIEG